MNDRAHWDTVYESRSSEELGWFESKSSTLALLTTNSTPADSVLDVGGGDSRLTDELLDRGYGDVTVLDLSEVAIERARVRLGSNSHRVSWICADVTEFVPTRTWKLWHDRAVFHFLVSEEQRHAYRAAILRSISPGGIIVVAAFDSAGPDHCAGLPVCRYDAESLPAEFVDGFDLISVGPIAPASSESGDQRPYLGAVFTVNNA